MDENKILKEREEKIAHFFKKDRMFSVFMIAVGASILFAILSKFNTPLVNLISFRSWMVLAIFALVSCGLIYFDLRKYAFYPIVGWIAWLAVEIRTLNLPGLRDVTTGGWTLGPDLDPFLFYRWMKEIVEQGSLMLHDAMRYVPLGYSTHDELLFLPYLMAWFHKIAVAFGSVSIEQSAVLFPVFMFALTVIAFFILVRKIFLKSLGNTNASIISLVASFIFAITPSFIPRTIAGIPEKESAAFFFMFLAYYFFICAWQADKHSKRIVLALLAGLSTAGMALIWGGSLYIYLALAMAVFIAFLFGQVDVNKVYIYAIWLLSSFFVAQHFTTRYTIMGFISSPATMIATAVLGIIFVHSLIYNTRLHKYFQHEKLSKIPKPIISLAVTIILGAIFATIIFGPGFVFDKAADIKSHLVTPISDRLGVTVAENRQPFFSEWADSFGPTISGFPIMFWLFFVGSVYLFYFMTRTFEKRERIIITLSYLVFLTCIIFSRYSSNGLLNGTNAVSLLVYALGFIALLGTVGYYYYQYHKNQKDSHLREIEFGLIFVFAFFFLCIVSARGAVRLIMMLVPPASIIVAYLVVASANDARKLKDSTAKIISWILVILIILMTAYASLNFYGSAKGTAAGYVPSAYNQQWQEAMSWVRDSTPQDAVFAHWWDYGYWVQSIGQRATVLDGGNAIAYWDYLMGRYGLTEPNDSKTLEFFFTHKVSHLLIDSTDIGKYNAFSSIGSDENFDRESWIPTMLRDDTQTLETKNTTMYVYAGGTPLDDDIIYEANSTKIFLPGRKSDVGLGGVVVEKDVSGKVISNPIAVFVSKGKQYRIPLRYLYSTSTGKLIDFGSGLEAGAFLFPRLDQGSAGYSIANDGAMLYLSKRTVKGTLARYYLYNSESPYFKLAHTEDDFLVKQLKSSNATTSDFVYYGGLRGPIKIWEISYPKDIKANSAFLEKAYPDERLQIARM
ncbi:MAG: hypothetical protein MUF61_02905 [archaeon]|jgi:MFS family permease|nr:hypothetical protein [archaeon]